MLVIAELLPGTAKNWKRNFPIFFCFAQFSGILIIFNNLKWKNLKKLDTIWLLNRFIIELISNLSFRIRTFLSYFNRTDRKQHKTYKNYFYFLLKFNGLKGVKFTSKILFLMLLPWNLIKKNGRNKFEYDTLRYSSVLFDTSRTQIFRNFWQIIIPISE